VWNSSNLKLWKTVLKPLSKSFMHCWSRTCLIETVESSCYTQSSQAIHADKREREREGHSNDQLKKDHLQHSALSHGFSKYNNWGKLYYVGIILWITCNEYQTTGYQ